MFTPRRRRREYRSNWRETASADRQALGLKCEKCGSTDKVQRHHIVSMNRDRKGRGGGGPDNLLNLQLLCEICHLRQHRRKPRKR